MTPLKKVRFVFIFIFIQVFASLPFPLLYLLSDVLAWTLQHLIRYRKQTISDNLRLSFPDKNVEERLVIARKFYSHLADLLVEGLKMFRMNETEIRARFLSPLDVANPSEKDVEALRLIASSHGCICMLGHYGNWEWASFASSFSFPNKKSWIIYKPLNDKSFDQLINQTREKFGAEVVEMKNVLRKFVSQSTEPFLAYFVSDQSPMSSSSHHKITFLHQQTLVYLGAEKIARSRNIPVIYVEIKKIRRGYYTSAVEILTENPAAMSAEEINALYQRRLEKTIETKPEYWLWSHKRWKYTR